MNELCERGIYDIHIYDNIQSVHIKLNYTYAVWTLGKCELVGKL